MPEPALVPEPGRCTRDHRRLADRLQPGAPTQFVGIPDARGIRNRLCKCGKQTTLSTFAQPRLLRSKFAAKLKPEYSHLPGLNPGGSSGVPYCLRRSSNNFGTCMDLTVPTGTKYTVPRPLRSASEAAGGLRARFSGLAEAVVTLGVGLGRSVKKLS